MAARHVSGASVLDVGCNIAAVLDYLPRTIAYVGLEVMPEVVELNIQRFPDREFIACDVQGPWPDDLLRRRFHHVLLLAVLEHLSDPVSALAQARTVLAEGGSVIVTTPHPTARRPHELGARLGLFSSDASEEHEEFFDATGLTRLAAVSGLNVVSYERFQLGMNQLAVLRGTA
jgi:SAM-dependent methyltransferase